LSALSAWRASSYRTVNIYFGGANRGCTQPNLSAAWVRGASTGGWRLFAHLHGTSARVHVRLEDLPVHGV
jgi:hypothetical protein